MKLLTLRDFVNFAKLLKNWGTTRDERRFYLWIFQYANDIIKERNE